MAQPYEPTRPITSLDNTLAPIIQTITARQDQVDLFLREQLTLLNTLVTQVGRLAERIDTKTQGSLPSNSFHNPRNEEANKVTNEDSKVAPSQPSLLSPVKERSPVTQTVEKKSSPNPKKVSIPFPGRLKQRPDETKAFKYTKYVRRLMSNKEKVPEVPNVPLTAECSAVLQNSLPEKLGDTGRFTIPCSINQSGDIRSLADLGASINLMPHSLFKRLELGDLKPTKMSVQLVDQSIRYPKGIASNIMVKVDKFLFPTDFVVMDIQEDINIPIILGRPFMNTARALIDVHSQTISLRAHGESITFEINKTDCALMENDELYTINVRKVASNDETSESVVEKEEEKETLADNVFACTLEEIVNPFLDPKLSSSALDGDSENIPADIHPSSELPDSHSLSQEIICIPIVSTHEQMISVIDEYDSDPHIIIAAIRNSTNDYSIHQRWLIAVIEAASTILLASKGTQDPLILKYCIRVFADALKSQLKEERKNAKELYFYIEQRQIYRKVYDSLMGSAFPYSPKQREILGVIRRLIEEATGNPSNYADMMIMRNLRTFLDLLAAKDHLSTKESNRFVIRSILEHHIKLIIEELRYITWDERRRNHSKSVKNMSTLDVVTYVVTRLHDILNAEDAEKAEFILHAGYREIFNKLIHIFTNSSFPFTFQQHQLIENLRNSIAVFGGNLHTEEFKDLKLKLLAFMESFKLRHPMRELIKTRNNALIDPNGPVTKAVDYITQGLLGLSIAAQEQFQNFKMDTMELSDLISTMACHFQRIYPPRYTFPQPRAHNENSFPNI